MENGDEMKGRSQNLKHLGFVRATAIKTIVWLANMYEYAKQNSGPLKSAVGTVENAVTSVITPVFTKFKDVPDHLLVFLDAKVDVGSSKFDEHAPPLVKQVCTQLHGLVDKTTQVTKELLHHVQVGGPLEAARYAAHESQQVVLKQSVNIWSKLDQLPPFHTVAEMTVPTAAHFTHKYNNLISDLRQKGYTVFGYLPLVPVDEIARAFKQAKPTSEAETRTAETQAVSQ